MPDPPQCAKAGSAARTPALGPIEEALASCGADRDWHVVPTADLDVVMKVKKSLCTVAVFLALASAPAWAADPEGSGSTGWLSYGDNGFQLVQQPRTAPPPAPAPAPLTQEQIAAAAAAETRTAVANLPRSSSPEM